jgi:hypothetical protein
MGPFSRREDCPTSPDLIEIESERSGKIHVMTYERFSAVDARLDRMTRAFEYRRAHPEGIEPEKQDRFPKAAILFRTFKSKLPIRSLKPTTASPVAPYTHR